MNCKPGDLAIVVVPADWPRKTLAGKVVEVVRFVPPRGPQSKWDQRPTWWCRFNALWFTDHGKLICEGHMLDSWLRPISGVPVHDERHDEATRPAFVVPAHYVDIVEPT